VTGAEIAAWVAPMMSLVGVWAYGRKSVAGPIIGILSQVPWSYVGYEAHLSGMLLSSIAFGSINGWNLWKWVRQS
jgi:nicotinamide riboside transporter PnuC